MPGVIGTLVLAIIVNLTAFAIVREREAGTLEQNMVSPIRPAEFIFGKTVPFFFVGLSEVAVVVAVGFFGFRSLCCWARRSIFSVGLRWAIDLYRVLDPAAGVFHEFLCAQSAFSTIGPQLHYLHHAGGAAVVHLH